MSGPNVDFGAGELQVRSRSILAGVSIGAEIPSSPTFSLVPAAGLAYVAERATLEIPGSPKETLRETYGIVDAGIGVVFNQRLTVRISASIPVGIDEASSSLGLAFGVNF